MGDDFVYLAGPMSGIADFNFPAFKKYASLLRREGYIVFNPAERDIERHNGVNIGAGNATGSIAVAEAAHGFSLRDAMHDDLVWICKHATIIALMPGWEQSKGTRVEHALAAALGLEFKYLA